MSDTGLVIIGASGHGKVAYQIARATGREVLGFVDAGREVGEAFLDVTVIAKEPEDCAPLRDGTADWFVAIGNNRIRETIFGRMKAVTDRPCTSLVDLSAQIAPGTEMGAGVFIAPGAVINIASRLGDGAILNTGAVLDHDGVLGDFAQVCPGATLAGATEVGSRGFVGTGASTIPCMKIGADAVVGAGAVVIRDVPEGATVVGVPAKPL